jgi:hypothetical protein
MRYSLPVVTVLVSSSLLNHLSHAAAAVGWRGDGTGLYPKANPVLEWSPTENVVWKTPLPEWGNSMPVLVSGKLFLNVEPDTRFSVRCEGRDPLEAAREMEEAPRSRGRRWKKAAVKSKS